MFFSCNKNNVLYLGTSIFLKKKYYVKYIALLSIYLLNYAANFIKNKSYHRLSSHIWDYQPKCPIVSCCILTYIRSLTPFETPSSQKLGMFSSSPLFSVIAILLMGNGGGGAHYELTLLNRRQRGPIRSVLLLIIG